MEFRFCPWCAAGLAPRAVPGDGGLVDRLACTGPDCGFVHWGNPTPAVVALVDNQREIILARGLEFEWDERAPMVPKPVSA